MSSPALLSYSVQTILFLKIKQNLYDLNYHFGGYAKIFMFMTIVLTLNLREERFW